MVKSKSVNYEALILNYKDGKSALIRNYKTMIINIQLLKNIMK
jgi:hypothetical protein